MLSKLMNKETAKVIGKGALRFGKAVVVDGLKAQALKGAKAAITTGFESGMDGIKKLTLDDVIGKEKVKTEKKSWNPFKKKDEIEVVLEEVTEDVIDAEFEEVEAIEEIEVLKDEDVEIIEPK